MTHEEFYYAEIVPLIENYNKQFHSDPNMNRTCESLLVHTPELFKTTDGKLLLIDQDGGSEVVSITKVLELPSYQEKMLKFPSEEQRMLKKLHDNLVLLITMIRSIRIESQEPEKKNIKERLGYDPVKKENLVSFPTEQPPKRERIPNQNKTLFY